MIWPLKAGVALLEAGAEGSSRQGRGADDGPRDRGYCGGRTATGRDGLSAEADQAGGAAGVSAAHLKRGESIHVDNVTIHKES